MNYLAHSHLANRNSYSILGNIMGDFRKYIVADHLPEKVMAGIVNHARVDKYTDNHPVVNKLKSRFSKTRRRFAGIIIDISFDHFLSMHWHKYNSEDRCEFILYVYQSLDQNRALMPRRMQQVAHIMITEDWLGSYVCLQGIEKCLNRMSHRIRFKNNLYGAIEEVKQNYEILEQGFLEFYPQLNKYVNN